METLNKITLRNANIDMLRALFASSLKCDGKLSFSLNDQRIRTDAGNSSFVKSQTLNVLDICEHYESTLKDVTVKALIYNGTQFNNRVLAAFGSSAMIEIYVKQIGTDTIAELIVISNNQLKINQVCSMPSLGYFELSDNDMSMLFDSTTNLRKLDLTSNHFGIMSSYGSLNTGDKELPGIEIRTTERGLIAKNNNFEYVIDSSYPSDLSPITIHKSMLSFIDGNEEFECSVITNNSGHDIMRLKSKKRDLRIAMTLVYDIAADFDAVGDDGDLPF